MTDNEPKLWPLRLAFIIWLVDQPCGAATWKGPTDPAMHAWFDSLASGNGLCCSFADGVAIEDVDWGTERVTLAGQSVVTYWVMLDGRKIIVPPGAVVTVPNKFGRAVVWPYQDMGGVTQIRCFLPGAGA